MALHVLMGVSESLGLAPWSSSFMSSLVLASVEVGQYISAWKALPVLVVLLLWGRLATWVDKDSVRAHIPRDYVNLMVIGAGVLGFVLFFVLPGFWVALVILCLTVAAAGGIYLALRHQKVGLGDLKGELTGWLKGMGKQTDATIVKEVPHEIQMIDKGGNLLAPPPDDSPERIGYEAIQAFMAPPLQRGCQTVDLTPQERMSACTYTVDGVLYQGRDLNRDDSGAAILYLKRAAGLDVNDRRKPQSTRMKVMLNGQKREIQVSTAGSTAGESLKIVVDPKACHELKLEDLGMTPEQLEQMREIVADRQGVVLVAAPPEHGLTTTLYAVVRTHDAFLNHILTIERGADGSDLEGINQNKLPAKAPGSEEMKAVELATSHQPDVLMVNSIEDPRTAQTLIKYSAEDKRVYVGMRAGSTFDALGQWRKLVGDDKLAMKQLRLIIAGRLVRRLCSACKVGYAPDPQTLRKLNMDPNRVAKLYQARTEPLKDPKGNPIPCEFCHDLHFKGRVGVYEFFLIDDEMRQVVVAGGSSEQLKARFRKQRGTYLQEQALQQVEAGETSVQEILRVLRSDGPGGGGPSKGTAPGMQAVKQ
ncbi:MAG: GspE/PulE family protein [Tepidisphaeraceae bacterium]